MALWDRVAPAERRRYPFALHQIDWEDYLFNTHLPGIRKCDTREDEPPIPIHNRKCSISAECLDPALLPGFSQHMNCTACDMPLHTQAH
jgi:hypothetical protein